MNLNDRIVRKALEQAEKVDEVKASEIDRSAMMKSLEDITGLSKVELDQIAELEKKKYFVRKCTLGFSILLLAVVLILMKSIFFPPKIDYLTQNITINHSNEFPLGSSGEIVGWTNVQGEWKKRSENPIAFDGESYFFAGASSFAELRQDISIEQYTTHDSSLYFDISAHTRSYHEGDYSRIIIQLLDGSKVISEYDSGEMEHKLDWTPVEMRGQVETHSDTIRIRLISRRKKGHNNDGYFDLVSCRLFTKT